MVKANTIDEIPKAYNPKLVEQRIYNMWVEGGHFTPILDQTKKPFVIIMPPPNVTGELHDPEHIKECLVEQITGSVRWSQSSKAMASEYDGCDWHELAPSGVLRGLMRRIERTIKVIPHNEPTQDN